MRNYNYELINIQYALMEVFLFKADKNVLDISYSIDGRNFFIQVVLLDGYTLTYERIKNIKEKFSSFEVVITELHLTKSLYNESKEEWQPKYYKWLDYLLFSKAEVQ
jgi:hypothetical protein